MKSRALFDALILAAAVGALAFRLPRLSERPMHGDEAVQAIKAGDLAATGVYRYDPKEFHGPTLYYLSLAPMWLRSAHNAAEADEATFRIVPVVFGVGLILLLLLMGDGLGRPEAVCAAVLTAVSPAMVYYSRYYVQEMLLVFFTFAAIAFGWRYVRSPRLGWAVLTGAALALMHATKETCIIAYGSMALALALTLIWGKRGQASSVRSTLRAVPAKGACPLFPRLNVKHLAAALIAAAVVSALLFSSFVTNPRGPIDSVLAFGGYLHRADRGLHLHPWWYYYLKMLVYTKLAPGPWWSEGLIVALAAVGFIAAMLKRKVAEVAGLQSKSPHLIRFLAFFTLAMTVVYSKIPYKTPWCMLSFLEGMILLAGVGAVALVRLVPTVPGKAVLSLILAAATYQLAGQAHRASFKFACDNRNPYVYSHPVTDVLHLVKRVEDIAQLHPDGRDMVVKIIAPDSDYWPIPWYLRRFPNIGYWIEPPDDADAPVIVASVGVQEALDKKLRDKYQISYFGLRPHVVLLLYIRADLWDRFLGQERATPGPR